MAASRPFASDERIVSVYEPMPKLLAQLLRHALGTPRLLASCWIEVLDTPEFAGERIEVTVPSYRARERTLRVSATLARRLCATTREDEVVVLLGQLGMRLEAVNRGGYD